MTVRSDAQAAVAAERVGAGPSGKFSVEKEGLHPRTASPRGHASAGTTASVGTPARPRGAPRLRSLTRTLPRRCLRARLPTWQARALKSASFHRLCMSSPCSTTYATRHATSMALRSRTRRSTAVRPRAGPRSPSRSWAGRSRRIGQAPTWDTTPTNRRPAQLRAAAPTTWGMTVGCER